MSRLQRCIIFAFRCHQITLGVDHQELIDIDVIEAHIIQLPASHSSAVYLLVSILTDLYTVAPCCVTSHKSKPLGIFEGSFSRQVVIHPAV